MKKVDIYTDGACSGNPGPGGFGVILKHGDITKEISAGYKSTTNNRMELLAVITGLEALKMECEVTIYSDSKYVVDAIEKGWALSWQQPAAPLAWEIFGDSLIWQQRTAAVCSCCAIWFWR